MRPDFGQAEVSLAKRSFTGRTMLPRSMWSISVRRFVILKQQLLNGPLSLFVFAFANVHAAHPTFPVDDEESRPRLDLVSLPGLVIVVGYDRILDAQRSHFAAYVVDVPLF